MIDQPSEPKQRQRRPSKRAMASRERILDAAERVFARGGFDGATIRDIASEADVPVGLVHHHGGGKEALFGAVIDRRADTISQLRLQALEQARAADALTTKAILRSFIEPYVEKAMGGDVQWLSYVRLVAIVSSDRRWHELSEKYFDPAAGACLQALAELHPQAQREHLAEGYVYAISAMLALITSQWRIDALAGRQAGDIEGLLAFCTAGFEARLAHRGAPRLEYPRI